MKKTFTVLFIVASMFTQAQDSATIEVNGYIDGYYAYNFNEPVGGTPYMVSSAQHNNFSINLAMLDMKYKSDRVRARFAPGFGSYMNANYAAEVGSFRNIVEASAGVKLFKNKEVWIDAGILGAPFSYENAISKDQIMYSRSLAAEGSPYYVTGVKLTAPLAKDLKGAVYLVNGWQQITDVNKYKSVIAHLEYHPDNFSINLAGYFGDERNIVSTNFRERYLIDFNINYKDKENPFSFSFGGYYGGQKVSFATNNSSNYFNWWQTNIAAKYQLNKKWAVAGRVEYYIDPNRIIYPNITNVTSFETASITLGGSYAITPNALFRLEGRHFFDNDNIFIAKDGGFTNASTVVWASLAVNFGFFNKTVKQ